MTVDDPFEAQHPDNLPAFRLHHHLLDAPNGALPAGITASPGWDTEFARRSRYPLEVGWDPATDRLRVPISYREWLKDNLHPSWPDYLDEMNALPPGQAVGFADWLDRRTPGRGEPGAVSDTITPAIGDALPPDRFEPTGIPAEHDPQLRDRFAQRDPAARTRPAPSRRKSVLGWERSR